jgi:molybdopterin-binding protein
MKLSARNKLRGKILDVKKGATTAHVRLEIAAVPRTRSSHEISEHSDANFGFKGGTSKGRVTSVLIDSEVRRSVPQTLTNFGIGTLAQVVTASITNEAVEELGLKAGGTAIAIVKASDVMIAVD